MPKVQDLTLPCIPKRSPPTGGPSHVVSAKTGPTAASENSRATPQLPPCVTTDLLGSTSRFTTYRNASQRSTTSPDPPHPLLTPDNHVRNHGSCRVSDLRSAISRERAHRTEPRQQPRLGRTTSHRKCGFFTRVVEHSRCSGHLSGFDSKKQPSYRLPDFVVRAELMDYKATARTHGTVVHKLVYSGSRARRRPLRRN